jgi:DNA mismatch repair endonuclease MutH
MSAPFPFDGRRASADEIMIRANAMVGRALGDLVTRSGLTSQSGRHTKGTVGEAVEAYFGLEPNPLAEPDFTSAAIELKTVPLRSRDNEIIVKERVYITMIDYVGLDSEEWVSSAAWHKLSSILFVYYEWLPMVALGDLRVTDVVLWNPSPSMNRTLESDWQGIKALVGQGRAEEISQSQGDVLMAATKGPGGPPRRRQPHSDVLVSSRAWALKPAFLRSILEAHRDRASRWSYSAAELIGKALIALRPFVERTVGDASRTLGLGPSDAKHRASQVFHNVLAERAGLTHADLGAAGIDLRVVQVDEAMQPYEALSFPAFRYQELIREDWEESELLSRLDRFLFVPIVGGKGLTALDSCIVHEPFSWAPSEAELVGIGAEWTMFRDEIEAGKAAELTPGSKTRYIHVRPKGRTRLDTDPAPGIGPVVKKCFWFNKAFVAGIMQLRS